MATLKELYNALKSDGAPLPDTYEAFESYMTSGPNGGYTHRKQVYDALKADGAPLPDSYEAFSRALFVPKSSQGQASSAGGSSAGASSGGAGAGEAVGTSGLRPQHGVEGSGGMEAGRKPQAASALTEGGRKPQVASAGTEGNKGSGRYYGGIRGKQRRWKPTPLQKAFMMDQLSSSTDATQKMMDDAVENTRRVTRSFTQEGRDEQKAGEMTARIAGKYRKPLGLSPTVSNGGGEAATTTVGNGEGEAATGTRSRRSPVVSGVKMENGELKTEYMLADGSLTTDFTEADRAEYNARSARLQHEFERRMARNGLDPAKREDVEKQRQKDLLDESEKRVALRLAENEANLRDISNRRGEEFDESTQWNDEEGFWDNMVRIIGSSVRRGTERQHLTNRPKESLTEDERNARTLTAENAVLNEARNLLETRQLKKSNGFMGGLWNVGNNWRNMKMGARHKLKDIDLYSGGVMSLQKASQLLDMENKLKRGEDLSDAEVSLLYSTMLGQDVEHNIETPHGYNAAQITVEMFPFMAQMMLNPASGLSSALVRKFGKSGVKKIAMTIAGDVAESAVLANTLQAPATVADAMSRYQGEATESYDEKGNRVVKFDGSHNWGTAIGKAEGSAIIENYTEMLGEHFGAIKDFAGKWIGKGVGKLGGGKIVDAVTEMTTKIKTSDWGKAIGGLEKRAHWNGTVGEVLEEEAGIVLNSMFVGDNKFSDLVDADQQIDIVLGVGLFGGFVSGIKSIGYPVGRARAKSGLRNADGVAGWRFGDEWESIRSEIDNAEESELAETVRNLASTHAKSQEQARSIVEYARALMKARGFDLALATATAEGNVTPEQQDAEESFSHGQSIAESGEPEAMRDARTYLDRQRERFVSATSEEFVAEHFDDGNALDNLAAIEMDDELRGIALDYVNARQVYDGMIQGVRDDVDARTAQSDAMIDSRVNRETGMIQPAVMKIDDRQVYIVNGRVSMYEDGTGVDTGSSSESIIIRDAETGKIEFADPGQLLSIGEGIDAESEKEAARNRIREEIAREAADKIDGVLSFAPGETYSVLDIDGNDEAITILGNSVDEEGQPVEGSVEIQYPDGTIQSVATADLQGWVDAANERRVARFAEERAAERAAADEAERQADEAGLSNPNRNRSLLPDNWKMPYYGFDTTATRYIESERGTGGVLYQDEQGNDAIVISAIDDNNYVGYFREYDEQGRPTNRWSAKFQNGSGVRENHRDMMQTAQELLPAGHELTEHTSVSTDGLRNLANQLKHGYELQYDDRGNVVTTEVMINMMAGENELGLSDYEAGSIEPARVSAEEYKEAAGRLIPYMEALGLSKFNIHWEDGRLYVDHPVLRRADTPLGEGEREGEKPQAASALTEEGRNDTGGTEEGDSVPNITETGKNAGESGYKVEEFGDGGIIITPDIVLSDEELAALAGEETAPSAATEEATPSAATEETPLSALSQIPTDEKGDPIYEQAEPGLAWDALVEETEDEQIAQNVIAKEIAERERVLRKLEKEELRDGLSTREKIKAEKDRKKAMEDVRRSIDHWKRMASTKQRREAEAGASAFRPQHGVEGSGGVEGTGGMEAGRKPQAASALTEGAKGRAERQEAERERAEREETERQERDEAERQEREALNGVPDWGRDRPQDARGRGYRRFGSEKVDRQEGVACVMGKEVEVRFGENELAKGRAVVIDVSSLQPSHIDGMRNPRHFIDEAQPKERTDAPSRDAARKIASGMRPEEITSSVTAYTGAPTVNSRGEAIQGNSRAAALRLMYESYPEQAAKYRQYLIDHAADFGLTPSALSEMERPVLVNMLDVGDEEAIRLGQFVAQDTESGGVERIKPKNVVKKMGSSIHSFANILLRSGDDEASLSSLVDANGIDALKWMAGRGFISDTQYASAFDSKGNLTGEASNDLKGILYHSIFSGGSTRLEEMFGRLPAKAQRAILATAFRDFDSAGKDRMIHEIQQSIIAFDAMMGYGGFAGAKNMRGAMEAMEGWKRQYYFDDVTGEPVLPSKNFSNFALALAAMYKGGTQRFIQQTFNDLYDVVQGTAPDTLFEQGDRTPRSLGEAIRKVLGFEYEPVSNDIGNGSIGGNAVDVDSPQGEAGGRRSDGDAGGGEREPGKGQDADGGAGTSADGGEGGDVTGRSLTREEAADLISRMESNAETAPEIELTIENWDAQFGESGIVSTPIGEVKMGEHQFTKLMRQGRNSKLGMIKPTLENPDIIIEDASEGKEGAPTERMSSYVFVKAFIKPDGSRYYYFTSVTVSRDGHEVVISNQEKRRNVLTNLLMKGKLVWKHADNVSSASDVADGLYSPQGKLSDPASEGTDAPQTNKEFSEGKVNSLLSGKQGKDGESSLGELISEAGKDVDLSPTDAQKKAGNYKKGHVQVGTFDVTIENPVGSKRRGTDAEGRRWETTMTHTYGYIRGTEGVDGDHIDVYLSSDIDGWNGRKVFVVDQYNPDGSFDEHKVMLGFNDREEAFDAYLSNYEAGWEKGRRLVLSTVNIEDFESWIESSHRKQKPFADYRSVKTDENATAHEGKDELHDEVRQWLGKKGLEPDESSRSAVMRYFKIGYQRAEAILNAIAEENIAADTHDGLPREKQGGGAESSAPYTITPTEYQGKKKKTPVWVVKFERDLSYEEKRALVAYMKEPLAEGKKTSRGWLDKESGQFYMRSEEGAQGLVSLLGASAFRPQHGVESGGRRREDGEGRGEAGATKAVTKEEWEGMNGAARLEVCARDPLTVEEIEKADADDVLKANALGYLRGKRGTVAELSYLNLYGNVRFTDRDSTGNNGSEDSAQLADSVAEKSDGGERGNGGGSAERMDREYGPADVSSERTDGQDSAGSSHTDFGEGGNKSVSGDTSGVEGAVATDSGSAGGRENRGNGSNGRPEGGKGSRSDARDAGVRNVEAGQGDSVERSEGKADSMLKDALDEFKSVLDEFIRAGREDLCISVIMMSSRQLEILPKLIVAGAKAGYALIRTGITKFSEWRDRMHGLIGTQLEQAGLTQPEIEEWIKEMWECEYTVEGRTRKVSEWAAVLGKENLRSTVARTLAEKREAQRQAEGVSVKRGDIENIRATLPFLLPQQQEDVLRAETQFFDESHNDRDHGYGKGYMFTNGTGTGKTYTGLGIVKRFVKEGKGRVLILTPSQTKVSDWIKDGNNLGLELRSLEDWAKEKGTTATTEGGSGAIVTTYANFRQNEALLEGTFDLIVYDESHRLLENKKGETTSGAKQHYKISNRDTGYASARLQSINPVWKEYMAKSESFQKKYSELVNKVKEETGRDNIFHLKVNRLIPPFINEEWDVLADTKFPELSQLRRDALALKEKFDKEEQPRIDREAEEAVKRTKVVFLSATPFNTRDNIDYAEGYIFSYPEDDHSRMSPRTRFFLDRFGAAYKYRYHRLENNVSNPAAVARQEVEFSDYLQNTLGTMSGRIIDSEYDYSRDFPTVTGDYAPLFNEAVSDFYRSAAMREACSSVLGNYMYSSALFESMKANQIIPRIEEHLRHGRKVVVFHRRVESDKPLAKPFELIFMRAYSLAKEEKDKTRKRQKLEEIESLNRKYKDLLEWEKTLDLSMPRDQLAEHFGKDNVLFFSGKESVRQKNEAVRLFNDDGSGKNIIVIQESSGKEGISLHDVTGEHQRVLITLALPQSPITALQTEGRIYRIGNRSNAIFEYPLLGLDSELLLFGQKFNSQVGTTENLALGSQARNLRESFVRGIEERSGDIDPASQGVGGKEYDAPYSETEVDPFECAVLDFYSNQKLTSRRDNREGKDYFPTPEPLGFMMAQWGAIGEGESVLEPSAGHGAIARYVPTENSLTAIEPSSSLFGKLQLKAGGLGRKFENKIFEDYNMVNKHDVVLMNPPFGVGGRLAVDHVAKAFSHLEEGGRVVAIIPRGSADAKFDKWYEQEKKAVVTGEILLPSVTFRNAGTSVSARVVVIDKVTDAGLRQRAVANRINIDLSRNDFAKIEDFFDAIRDIEMPARTIDRKARMEKKCKPAARELRKIVGEDNVTLQQGCLKVRGRGVWEILDWEDKEGDSLDAYLRTSFGVFTTRMNSAERGGKEKQVAVYSELRELCAKLSGRSVEEMELTEASGLSPQHGVEGKGESGEGEDGIRFRLDDEVEAINDRFNDDLERWANGEMKASEHISLGKPHGILEGFMPEREIILRQKVLTKARKKHGLTERDMQNLPSSLADPIFVFKSDDDSIGVLTELTTESGQNIFVAIKLGKQQQFGHEFTEVNDIASIHGRETENIVMPIIENDSLIWVDKKKGLAWLSSAKTNSQAIAIETFEDAAKIVKDFANPQLPEDSSSEMEPTVSPNITGVPHGTAKLLKGVEKSYDPGVKLLDSSEGKMRERGVDVENVDEESLWRRPWGWARRWQERRKAESERRRDAMREKVRSVAESCGVEVDIRDDASGLEGKKRRAKGWFDPRTGKIVIVLGNHSSIADAEATLLHEMVGHKGLRVLFGDKFEAFLDAVWANATEDVKERISQLAARNGWNRRVATEEYMASLAEDGSFKDVRSGWWRKLKGLFMDFLRSCGFSGNVRISDNELRYVLWMSYENLREPGRFKGILGEAARVAKEYELGVGEFAEASAFRPQHGVEDVRYSGGDNVNSLNTRFNNELKRFSDSTLKENHRFELGMPSRYLLSAGFPLLPISMRQALLKKKSQQTNHQFEAEDVRNLVKAIQKPLAIFEYSKDNVRNLIVSLEKDGKHFLVGVTLGFKRDGLEINSISGLFPKQDHEWIKWIQDGKAIRIDQKEKVLRLIDSLRINPAEAERIGLDLESATKIVENFENPRIEEGEDEELRFRDGDFTPRDRKMVADVYEKMLSRGSWQFQEAVQDSMLGLKSLYEAILTEGDRARRRDFRIEEVAGYENAYLYENRMSSANNGEQQQYFIQYMKPLLKSVHALCGSDAAERRILTDYMMAKHGLERNAYMRKEAENRNSSLLPGQKPEKTERDFAGLCGLTGEKNWKRAEAAAQKMVDDYERDHEAAKVSELWKDVKRATSATLEKIYLTGLISEETYSKVAGMYDYYIPLRGWEERTSDEVYGYLTSKDGPLMGNVFKKAEGRRSKADDPIAFIAQMADDAIRQGNRNVMKQRFLNFVLGNPSDLVSVNELWLQHNDVTDEWEPVFADLSPDMTAGDVFVEVAKFEAKMESLRKSEPDKYKRGREARHIPYKVVKGNLREHQVLVRRNGRTYVMTVNGNPRAAQALNGLTNPDVETGGVTAALSSLGTRINRELSALYTTRNPDFIVSNFMRDMIYSNTQVWVKENPRYSLQFLKNCGKFSPMSPRRAARLRHGPKGGVVYSMGMLFRKWENGTLDMGDKYERLFKEFMLNGGETGYTSVKDIERHKESIAAELRKQGSAGRKAWAALGQGIETANRSVENCARFAAYVTSREMGRSIDRSIYDAKEISVNFNKKGSGGKFFGTAGQTSLGNFGAGLSWAGRGGFAFWNAGVQGLTNYLRGFKRNPVKAIPASAVLFGFGMGIHFLNLLLMNIFGGGDGDDDDKDAYYNLPEYVRRSNVCIWAAGKWIAIPLPIEYRAMYGLGELATGVLTGKERYSGEELTFQLMGLVSQLMPIDMLEGGAFSSSNEKGIEVMDIIHPFVPTAFKPMTEAYIMNKGWTGLPISKQTPFNELDPEFKRVYQSADQHLVEFSRWLNNTLPAKGDDYTKGTFDLNPAKIEYVLKGYLGGAFSFPSNTLKWVEALAGKREFEWKHVPLANRVVKTGDDRTENRKLQNEYYKYRYEAKKTKYRFKGYLDDKSEGILGAAERVDFLYNSDEFLRYQIFERFEPDINVIREEIKGESDPEAKRDLEGKLYSTMRKLVDALHEPDEYLKSIGVEGQGRVGQRGLEAL